jgi:hypothetical protein
MISLWYFTCHYFPSAALSHHTYVYLQRRKSRLSRSLPYATLNLALAASVIGAAGMGASCSGAASFRRSDAAGSSAPGSSPAGSSNAPQQLPFHDSGETLPDENSRPAVPAEGPDISAPPAFQPLIIPAGTLLMIQLDDPLSISRVHAGDSFTASLIEPLRLGDEILAKSGDPVNGHVESAQPSLLKPGAKPVAGYVRLTLTAISIDHRAIPLQTSSLFAKAEIPTGNRIWSVASKSDEGHIQKGRLLTFRLSAPLMITPDKALARR